MIHIFPLCKHYAKGVKNTSQTFFSYGIKIVLNFKKIKDFSKIIKSDTIDTNKLTLGGFFPPSSSN